MWDKKNKEKKINGRKQGKVALKFDFTLESGCIKERHTYVQKKYFFKWSDH